MDQKSPARRLLRPESALRLRTLYPLAFLLWTIVFWSYAATRLAKPAGKLQFEVERLKPAST